MNISDMILDSVIEELEKIKKHGMVISRAIGGELNPRLSMLVDGVWCEIKYREIPISEISLNSAMTINKFKVLLMLVIKNHFIDYPDTAITKIKCGGNYVVFYYYEKPTS